MFKKQIDDNIEDLDIKIGLLTYELGSIEDNEELYDRISKRLEKLIELRCKLSESRVKESKFPTVLSGAVQVSSILLVLHYEKTDIVTSKAFGMATKIFKGR